MDTNFFTLLQSLGYTQREAAVYLACLELGEASVQKIAAKAGIERTGTYEVLRRLMELGLIEETFVKGKRLFIASPPEMLKEMEKTKLKNLSQSLPQLESLYNRNLIKPKIHYYESVTGIKTVLDHTLGAKSKQLCGILSVHDLFDVLGEQYMEEYVNKRIANHIALRVIRSKPKEVGDRWHTNESALRQLRYAPDHYIFSMTQYIFDTTVLYISSKKEGFGLIIESEELMHSQKNLFEALWMISKPDKKDLTR